MKQHEQTLSRVAASIALGLIAGLGSPQIISGIWTQTTNHNSAPLATSLLLTDGTVICQLPDTPDWWKLTPDINGSYQNGTWSQIASLPGSYGPLYYASAVLDDGRVVVIGGEYNNGSQNWTNLGAIYTPTTNTWANLPGPGWSEIGDAQCVVLPDGTFLLADILNEEVAVLNPITLTWSIPSGRGKSDRFDEEGWTLLPDGTVLTCLAIDAPGTQRYLPALAEWISAGSTPHSLEDPGSQELGPQVLRPDGTVFATGATGYNAVYTPPSTLMGSGTWVSAPTFPVITQGQLDIADGPACLLPDGNVLCAASPGVFNSPCHFFEFDGTNLTQVEAPPRADSDSSNLCGMLMLPTGQVLFTDHSNTVELYTPAGTYQAAWQPTITSVASTLHQSSANNGLQGTQLNGLSECSAYGDDLTNATNYPLVRIQNGVTGHVFYCRTHNHSTMAVATGNAVVSTQFDVPAGIEIGQSNLYVVTNGIPSLAHPVSVVAPNLVLPNSYTMFRGTAIGGSVGSLFFNDSSYLATIPGPTLNAGEAPDQVQVSGTSPLSSPASFQLTFTGHVNTVGVTQTIELYNFSTNAYETLRTQASSNGTDSTMTVSGTGTLSRYVNQSTGEVRARVTFAAPGPTSLFPWTASLNVVNWEIE